jgi:hypothetical protein
MASGIVPRMAFRIPTGGTMTDDVRENRLRRMAQRQGLILRKSRRRDPRAVDFGSYWLIDASTNALVAGGQFGMSLDSIEEHLTQ